MSLLKDRHNLKLVVVAAACLTIGLSTPAVSHGVHAQFAHNADKVDGRHAVGAGTSPSKRAGKLVATNTAGRLPNNIVARPPDADRVDGMHAHQLTRAGMSANESPLALTTLSVVYGEAMTITAPRAGFVVVNASASVWNNGCSTTCTASIRVRHDEKPALSPPSTATLVTGAQSPLGVAWVFPVAKGVNTFTLRASRGGASGSIYLLSGQVTGLFVPFGHKGGNILN